MQRKEEGIEIGEGDEGMIKVRGGAFERKVKRLQRPGSLIKTRSRVGGST